VGQSILCRVGARGVVAWLMSWDAALAIQLNALVRGSGFARALAFTSATRLASFEVFLMGALAVAGRRRPAGRMLAAVGLVYLGSEVLGQP
jgi:hypothetical protein